MWYISSFTLDGKSTSKNYCCDGQPILGVRRGPEGSKFRFMVAALGYIDILDTGAKPGGPHYWTLDINGHTYWYDGDGEVIINVSSNGSFIVTGDGNDFEGTLLPIPTMEENVDDFRAMMADGIVPYQDPPSGKPKTPKELQSLGKQYYPGDVWGYDKAICLYDWTSASFIRQDLFNQLQYTGVDGRPLDLKTMARVIWSCNYPGYSVKDANFMNQFMMKPANSEQDVYEQLLAVQEKLKPLSVAELNIQILSLLTLEQPTVAKYPQLYRGAMPMSGGYNTSDFAPSMFEFPGNNGPTDQPLVQDLTEALDGILKPGSIITTKGPWSFSNDLEGAKVWQNGILITCNPPEGATVWPGCADITPFSLNPDTFEINVAPVTRYKIEKYEWIEIKGAPVCHFTMTMLGYCGVPM